MPSCHPSQLAAYSQAERLGSAILLVVGFVHYEPDSLIFTSLLFYFFFFFFALF